MDAEEFCVNCQLAEETITGYFYCAIWHSLMSGRGHCCCYRKYPEIALL